MEEPVESPRTRRSLRSRGCPQIISLSEGSAAPPKVSASPCKVSPRKGGKKSSASKTKVQDKSADSKGHKVIEIIDGPDEGKAVEDEQVIPKVLLDKSIQVNKAVHVESGEEPKNITNGSTSIKITEKVCDRAKEISLLNYDEGIESVENLIPNKVQDKSDDSKGHKVIEIIDGPDEGKAVEDEQFIPKVLESVENLIPNQASDISFLNDDDEEIETEPPIDIPDAENYISNQDNESSKIDGGIEPVAPFDVPNASEKDDNDITWLYDDEPSKSDKNDSNKDAEFIELDRVGQVDMDDTEDIVTIVDEDEDALKELEQIRSEGQLSESGSILNTTVEASDTGSELIDFRDDYGFSDEEIELSGDEEDDRGDVTMLLMKRPPQTTVEVYEILDSDEEYPVCLAQGEKMDPINIEEKQGEIKEYIEEYGLGIIFKKEYGLILFHLENVWVDENKFNAATTKSKIPIGKEVSFYDQTFEGEEYKDLSSVGIIHQAVAVWVGRRVEHLLKKISEDDYIRKLEDNRNAFMEYLKNRHEVFVRVDRVRAKAQIVGYLTNTVGILKMKEGPADKQVLFHVDNVHLFKKPIRHYTQMMRVAHRQYTANEKQLLPVGLNVSVDARKVFITGVRSVDYQAILVLAGTWPQTIHPTLLPGGEGSTYPSSYDVVDGHTFYYLELDLGKQLGRKVCDFRDILARTRGRIVFDFGNTLFINGSEDHMSWKEQFTGKRPANKSKSWIDRGEQKKEVCHLFKAPPPRPPIVIKEVKEETESVTATAGGSYAGSVSDMGSVCSRPASGMSQSSHSSGVSGASSVKTTFTQRTWYNRNWHCRGGLRIKNEVKTEDEDGPSLPKRMKPALWSVF